VELETRVEQRTAELDKANRSLRRLTARLLHFQDEERRRLARELHDSVGQIFAALSMNLSSVGADIQRLAERCLGHWSRLDDNDPIYGLPGHRRYQLIRGEWS
jgi:signal transduction histidine kinase